MDRLNCSRRYLCQVHASGVILQPDADSRRNVKPGTGSPACTFSQFSLVRHLQPPRRTYKHAREVLLSPRGYTDEVCMSRLLPFRCSVTVLALFAICGVSAPAAAQYFGQNKVHYRSFDFQVMKTDHFDIYFYESERPAIDIAARLAEAGRVRFAHLMKNELSGRQPISLYGSHPVFGQPTVCGGAIGEGRGGVPEPIRRRIVLPLAGPL